MNIGDLKKIIENLPDDMELAFQNPSQKHSGFFINSIEEKVVVNPKPCSYASISEMDIIHDPSILTQLGRERSKIFLIFSR